MNENAHPGRHRDADRAPAAPDSAERTARDDELVVASDAAVDPFLVALNAAALDDEPFTDDDRAAVEAGLDAYARGESRPWTDVRQSLAGDDAGAKRVAS